MQPVISFKNFSFKYNAQSEPTLFNINLDIHQKEKILIAGPSGSGKSTLANCINGLVPFCYTGEIDGSLTINGKESKDLSIFDISKSVGTVLQDSDGQFIGLTVAEDIAFALENDCVEQNVMFETVEQVAELVSVSEFLDYAPHELSGGQKQRVGLAGVMVDNVGILLFDEPLANLDPATGKKTIELIDKIQETTQTTIVIIEHRIEDVLWRSVDRIILMAEGRIISNLSTKELLATSLLEENGIREPLYITALKYAGVELKPSLNAEHIDSLVLQPQDKEKVRNWFLNAKPSKNIVSDKKILEIQGVTFGYNPTKTTLNNVSFCVNQGEMISVVGKNGAGKSTLSKLICGFEKFQTGKILINGEDNSLKSIREIAKEVGYVMQNPNQMISKNMIYDEIALGLEKSGLSEQEKKEQIENTLKICGLYQFRNWPISALSFGQKKRVTIASVLVLNPKVIILDEPTAGQDFKHYTEIMEFLSKLNAKGVTVILITHNMHLMLEYTKRAVIFSDGDLIADTSSAEVLCNPELIEKSYLKETSLFNIANSCGIENPVEFVNRFIDYDKEVRRHGK